MGRIQVFIVPKYISKGRFRKTDVFLDHPDQRTCIVDSQKAHLGGIEADDRKTGHRFTRQCKLVFVFGR